MSRQPSTHIWRPEAWMRTCEVPWRSPGRTAAWTPWRTARNRTTWTRTTTGPSSCYRQPKPTASTRTRPLNCGATPHTCAAAQPSSGPPRGNTRLHREARVDTVGAAGSEAGRAHDLSFAGDRAAALALFREVAEISPWDGEFSSSTASTSAGAVCCMMPAHVDGPEAARKVWQEAGRITAGRGFPSRCTPGSWPRCCWAQVCRTSSR